jgi:UDP-N-acetylglucosamine 2-epimerase (non-hydrolysing)
VGVNQASIASGLIEILSNADMRKAMTAVQNPYGDGKASQRIADILQTELIERG